MNHEVEQEQSIEHLDFTIPCESMRCRTEWGRGDHDADWLVILTCGHEGYLCTDRFQYTLTVQAMGRTQYCPKCREPGMIATQHRLH